MRPRIQEALSKFSGKDLFIIGGGNSLRNFDFNILKDKNVIAVNSAYLNVGANAALFWVDGSWAGQHYENLKHHPAKLRFMPVVNAETPIARDLTGPSESCYLRRTGDFGYDPFIDNVKGNNSGAMAINFAINLKPSRIILLGFDLGYVAGKSHYHNTHTTLTDRSVYERLFLPSFNALADDVKNLGIKIYNCSLDSKFTKFPIRVINDFL